MRPFLLACLALLLVAAVVVVNQNQPAALNAPLNRPALYGINVDLKSDLEAIQRANFKWVRLKVNLDQYDDAATAAFIASAVQRDLRPTIVLTGTPPFDPERFAQRVTSFVERHRDTVDHYQILDEPNLYSTWNTNPNPAEYVRLLQANYTAIKKVNPAATIILAALAPTTETGPKNFNDILYLRYLYDLGAKDYFDAAAGKPYGFNATPSESTVDQNVLNFSHFMLLREEMVKHDDAQKFLWASEFGWSNQPSIWGHVTLEQQLQYTRQAYDRAQNEWAWTGPLFLQQPTASSQQPTTNFALDLQTLSLQTPSHAPVGTYLPQALIVNHYASFNGNWKFSELGADIPADGNGTITLNFRGTQLDLMLRRGDYRGYLYVTIDGQPANALPRDLTGKAYVILTSPDLMPHTETITLASRLAPDQHTAVIRAERGWGQWAIASITISNDIQRANPVLPLTVIGLLALVCFAGLFAKPSSTANPLQSSLQWLSAIALSGLLWISAGLTWSEAFADSFRKYGDTIPFIATLLTASIFYYSPALLLTLLCLVILFTLFYLRPNIGLVLTTFAIPFYLIPKNLWRGSFSMVEILLVLTVAAVILRFLAQLINRRATFNLQSLIFNLSASFTQLDLAVAAFVAVSFASIYIAEIRGTAIREFRVMVIEPAAFYFLLRLYPLTRKDLWRIVDTLILSATLVALIGYWQYFVTHENLITAEGGLMRMMSVLGSPNNLGLFLGRVLPLTVALALMGQTRARRWTYALACLLLLGAIILSFSKGALILGVPISIMVVIMFWGGRRAAIGLAALAGAGVVAAIPLSQNPRFADTFNFTSGTSFFRVQLWQSALSIIRDHPLLGVGLDNFLYQYRGRYILPEAWQEPNLAHAHNVFLDSLTRLGVFGLMATLWLLGAFFLSAYTTLKRLTDPDLRALTIGLIASMINFLAHGLVDTGYWFVDLAFVFMLTVGLLAALAKNKDSAW